MENKLRTTLLLAVLTALIIFIGRLFGGSQGMVIAFVLAVVMNVGSYWFSDKIVLAMYRAQPLDEQTEHDQTGRSGRVLSRLARS